jgi:hypothetical protein
MSSYGKQGFPISAGVEVGSVVEIEPAAVMVKYSCLLLGGCVSFLPLCLIASNLSSLSLAHSAIGHQRFERQEQEELASLRWS